MSVLQSNGLTVNGDDTTPRTVEQRTANLVKWASSLQYSTLPTEVVFRTKSFLLDTLACAIAGHTHPAVQSLLSFAKQMGPSNGKCEYIFTDGKTSAAFAALVNGAASHVVELDDLNNAGMIHPVEQLGSCIDTRQQLCSLRLLLQRRTSDVMEKSSLLVA
jgi:2-methylcitrate dehydratase PrpD